MSCFVANDQYLYLSVFRLCPSELPPHLADGPSGGHGRRAVMSLSEDGAVGVSEIPAIVISLTLSCIFMHFMPVIHE